MPKTKVVFENESYVGEALAPAEQSLLERQLRTAFVAKGSFYEELLRNHMPSVFGAAEVAKDKFDAPFTGLSAGDGEIGFQKIRSGHLRRTTGATETADNNWSFAFGSGNDYWVGYGTDNTTAANIDKEGLVLALGVIFTHGAQPTAEELLVQVGGTTYPVIVVRDAWAADNQFGVRAIPIRPLLLVPKATVLIQVRSAAAQTAEMVLLGVTFGLGRFLRQQSYSSISL